MAEPLLGIEDLTLSFSNEHGPRRILDGVTFDLYPHEVMGLVGESGSGKTMTSLAVMGLLPPTAKVDGGHIWFDGRDLLALPERDLREMRGAHIAMIFQSPRAALNPLMRAGEQAARALRLHRGLSREAAYATAVELLRHVGIPDAATRARAYPHQLSGGMAQRVLVAMMLACRPKLLIADEPTTGLDVTIQAQIFELIKEAQAEIGATLLLITHDLGVVSEVCQRVAVMYAGQIMEVAPVAELFAHPQHPYTERLLSSIIRVDQPSDLGTAQALPPISILYDVPGCHFANRCPYVRPVCWERRPPPIEVTAGHTVICHKYTGDAP
ncbi:MAG TPA: ABC transporter ATP-binding protein [Anaerolineae bacterium]|nr:ABC transporter ATP-binding protein [Anaerolineae bacterium]